MVLYFIQNMHLDWLGSSEYLKDLLSFLRKEMKIEHKSKFSSLLVGCYNGMQVDRKLIKMYPFEMLIGINSTIVRLQAIKNKMK